MEQISFLIANPRHAPVYKYDPKVDDSGVWVVYHSKGYLRKKRKMRFKKNLERELEKQKVTPIENKMHMS